MPWQLRNSNRHRYRHSEPRPTIELMPAININELRHAIPRYSNTINEPNVSLKYPDVAYLRLSTFCLEIMGRNGYVQRFGIAWIPTHFGRRRAILVCGSCSCGAVRLFAHYGTYACRHCHRAQYASQKRDKNGRRPLAAAKLRLRLGGLPSTTEPIPPSPNGHAAGLTNAFVTKSKPSKPKLRHGVLRSLSAHSSLPITSAERIVSYSRLSGELNGRWPCCRSNRMRPPLRCTRVVNIIRPNIIAVAD
jgi:hypothetical protein